MPVKTNPSPQIARPQSFVQLSVLDKFVITFFVFNGATATAFDESTVGTVFVGHYVASRLGIGVIRGLFERVMPLGKSAWLGQIDQKRRVVLGSQTAVIKGKTEARIN